MLVAAARPGACTSTGSRSTLAEAPPVPGGIRRCRPVTGSASTGSWTATRVIVGGERVRLIGMDAPESVKPDSPVECYGPEASAELKRLLPRRTPVLLEYDLDRLDQYGRTLAYVWLTDPPRLVNAELVRDGFATVRRTAPTSLTWASSRPPRTARAAGSGLWSSARESYGIQLPWGP